MESRRAKFNYIVVCGDVRSHPSLRCCFAEPSTVQRCRFHFGYDTTRCNWTMFIISSELQWWAVSWLFSTALLSFLQACYFRLRVCAQCGKPEKFFFFFFFFRSLGCTGLLLPGDLVSYRHGCRTHYTSGGFGPPNYVPMLNMYIFQINTSVFHLLLNPLHYLIKRMNKLMKTSYDIFTAALHRSTLTDLSY